MDLLPVIIVGGIFWLLCVVGLIWEVLKAPIIQDHE